MWCVIKKIGVVMPTREDFMKLAQPDIVFRILVGQDPEDQSAKTAMVVRNGELWFAVKGDKKDWNKRKTARAVATCLEKIMEDYVKKEML